jgi:hypothetical protein
VVADLCGRRVLVELESGLMISQRVSVEGACSVDTAVALGVGLMVEWCHVTAVVFLCSVNV